MPYIKSNDRNFIHMIDNSIVHLKLKAKNAGELQYQIALMISEYLLQKEYENGQYRYQDLNDILGALEGAKLEFYARVARPYEDKKIQENGDVY